MIKSVEYKDDMQMQTKEIQQRNIKASIDELNKYVPINRNIFIEAMSSSTSIHVVNSILA